MKQDEDVQMRLQKIRKCMQKEKIDAWIVLSSDFHESEYVGDYFKCREYLSGFSGSAGSLVILQKEAGLWTDGRYFLQAEKELKGSGITLYKKGEEGVPELEEYMEQKLAEHSVIGVDGRTISVSAYRKLKKKLEKKRIVLRLEYDLTGEIWEDRPAMSCQPAWELNKCYAGSSRAEKLTILRKILKKKGADSTVISSLDDIAWILNIRGNDVACTPVVLSFIVIAENDAIWFVQKKAVNIQLAESLKQDGITLRDYKEIYFYLSEELKSSLVYLDPYRTNILVYEKIQKNGKRTILEGTNISLLPKAIKNTTEIENMRYVHKKDAVACIKFMYWLKTQMKNREKMNTSDVQKQNHFSEEEKISEEKQITEITAAKKLEEYRKKQEHYLGPSFHTIAGYAQHGAIVHYSADPDSDLLLKAENFLLVDSGGHYLEGTTDITRTIALGALTWEQKHFYTLVLKGHIRLAATKFKYGCSGIQLDSLAREALWKENVDYNHGTGHGVGYLLSVHESPNSFRNAVSESKEECMKLEPGMITSNEPGIYLEGKFGIRLENLILCKEWQKNKYGRFLEFETLTLVPFERDAILTEELEEWEKDWLNQYHARIVNEIGGYLEEKELIWLKEVTAAV